MRVVIGLWGGVDSAVAALLLGREGHDVQGLYMHNWDDDDVHCTAAQDFQDARAVASELGIPLHKVDFSQEYREAVFAQFLAEHRAGRTPNPDVLCNREIKFGSCLAYARRLGGEALATGHYARLERRDGETELHKAADGSKDQSYFLHAVHREQLGAALFPLAGLDKSKVRALARSAGLPVHGKPDSTGICFIGERPFREFLQQYLPPAEGPIEDENGVRLGLHQGLHFHTLGQRAGLAIGGRRGASESPWYVARKDVAPNRLVVVQGHDHPLMLSREVRTGAMHWLCTPPDAPFEAMVKLRYRQEDQQARVVPQPDGGVLLEMHTPQRAVTPGQAAVVYLGSRCLGGGTIDATL